jgi:hypothetical protein
MKSLMPLIGFLASVLSTSAAAISADDYESPDFSLRVSLSEEARHYLREHGETVVVAVYFADTIGPEGNSLGTVREEFDGDVLMRVDDLDVSSDAVEALETANYEVLVNVFSGRQVFPMNVLSCEPLQERILALQRREHAIHCELGRSARRD